MLGASQVQLLAQDFQQGLVDGRDEVVIVAVDAQLKAGLHRSIMKPGPDVCLAIDTPGNRAPG